MDFHEFCRGGRLSRTSQASGGARGTESTEHRRDGVTSGCFIPRSTRNTPGSSLLHGEPNGRHLTVHKQSNHAVMLRLSPLRAPLCVTAEGAAETPGIKRACKCQQSRFHLIMAPTPPGASKRSVLVYATRTMNAAMNAAINGTPQLERCANALVA